MSPFLIRGIAYKLSTSNRRITIVENNASVALRRCIAQLKLATVDGKRRAFIALDNIQTTRVRTAFDGQRAPVVDHGGTRIARRSGHTRQVMLALLPFVTSML